MAIKFNATLIERQLKLRIHVCLGLVVVVFALILTRLAFLQILRGHHYQRMSTNNRIRVTQTPAPRGIITARDGTVLVRNEPSFDLVMIPQDTPDIEHLTRRCAELLELSPAVLTRRVTRNRGRPPFEPVVLMKELSWPQMSKILSHRLTLQGINIDTIPRRTYCRPAGAPHVCGFLGEVQPDQLRDEPEVYAAGDLVGRFGLEKWGELFLRGRKGGQQTEVDVIGNRQRILADIPPVAGSDICISLIPQLQHAARRLMQDHAGAVVAMDPRSGEILVLLSCPEFDPNLFSRGISVEDWRRLRQDSGNPLLNRAVQDPQPPGSIFKIVTAVAALEEGIVGPDETITCPGHYTLGNRRFGCWQHRGHGAVNLRRALVESCDVYFYELSLRVGIDTINRYARKLGFGTLFDTALEHEKAGLVPSRQWKLERYGTGWQKGETLITAIGQGFLLTTPLQVACVYSGIATRGSIAPPRVVLHCGDNQTTVAVPRQPALQYQLQERTWRLLHDALIGVVHDRHGTGRGAAVDTLTVAGKTGTAQVASKRDPAADDGQRPRHLRDHAWFAAFAPAEKPEIVVCVYIEHGGSGGGVAAPIAGALLACWRDWRALQREPLGE